MAPRQGCHRHSDMHTQAARTHAERAATHTSLQAPAARLAVWAAPPAACPQRSRRKRAGGASGAGDPGPGQGRGGSLGPRHPAAALQSGHIPAPAPIRRKLWAWLRGRQGHPGPGRSGSRGTVWPLLCSGITNAAAPLQPWPGSHTNDVGGAHGAPGASPGTPESLLCAPHRVLATCPRHPLHTEQPGCNCLAPE